MSGLSKMVLRPPKFTLFDLCGPGCVFNSKVPDNAASWSFPDRSVADAVTGNQLAVLGEVTVLCSAGVANHAGLELLREIGFDINSEIIAYTDDTDRINCMKSLAERGFIFIDQHVQPDARRRPGRTWVESSVLSFLNNKGNLHHVVPAPYLPLRERCESSLLSRHARRRGHLPVVIKAVTDFSCGSGIGIRICAKDEDIDLAQAYFSECDNVIIEDYLSMEKNLCVNYAVFPEGRIEYIGAAQQILKSDSEYLGNWLEPDVNVPVQLVETGLHVMAKAWHMGYRGFAGFDAAVFEGGSFYIYDLNFRFNGSTAPLLLYDALVEYTQLSVAKYAVWKYTGRFSQMITALERALERFQFVPISIYDPGDNKDARPQVRAMLFGASREEVAEKEKDIAALGFY